MGALRISLFWFLMSMALANENPDVAHITLPRPLVMEYPAENGDEDVRMKCTSWRVAAEANNLRPWKAVPEECGGYVKVYMTGKGYESDVALVSEEARVYARSVELGGDGKDAWVFDVDETLISNLPYYSQHGFGLEGFDGVEFDKWVEKGRGPAINSSLKLYQEIKELGFKAFLLTGRSDRHREVTEENLVNAGFQDWDKFILRSPEDHVKSAAVYKSEKRREMVEEGFRIVGNSGDQWSDLVTIGPTSPSISQRSFKLPNPMYYIP
ncbi:hypothetical protein DM860_016103 [Cuscuta australis]|uniref:Acid phosphatase n=1 Tax=Cuscuta australis TaxID=267555 RepID=A0A328E2L3_9ASTE|nr:hypothetical protein DM860_016103 [Cuscuta australis]